MAEIVIGTTSELVVRSVEGTVNNPDSIAIRLVDASGTVYLEKKAAAAVASSFFIKDAEIFSDTLVAGDEIRAVVASGTEAIRVYAPQTCNFGT